jgi:hypothetical protein
MQKCRGNQKNKILSHQIKQQSFQTEDKINSNSVVKIQAIPSSRLFQ